MVSVPLRDEDEQQQGLYDAKARWTAAVARVGEILNPQLMDDLTAYVYELQSELASNVQLVESMLTAQDQLGSEAQAQLRQLADVAADKILSAEAAQKTWRRRAEKMRSSAEAAKCVVCLERPRVVVMKPCMHLVVCSECIVQLDSHCPLCRGESTSADIVFAP